MKVRDIAPFGLRIKPELKEWFKNYSEKDKRSMNYSINEAMEFFKQHKEKQEKLLSHKNKTPTAPTVEVSVFKTSKEMKL